MSSLATTSQCYFYLKSKWGLSFLFCRWLEYRISKVLPTLNSEFTKRNTPPKLPPPRSYKLINKFNTEEDNGKHIGKLLLCYNFQEESIMIVVFRLHIPCPGDQRTGKGNGVLHLNTMVCSPPIQRGIGSWTAKIFGCGYNENRYKMERSVILTKMPIKRKKAFPILPLKCTFRLIKSFHKH